MQGPGPNQPQQPFDPNQPSTGWGNTPPIPPPVPPPTAPGGMGGPTPSFPYKPEISFDVISEAWGLLSQQMGVWIPTMLIFAVILWGISLVSQLVVHLVLGGAMAAGRNNEGVAAGAMGAIIMMSLVSGLIQMVLSAYLSGGLFRMAIRTARGEAVAIGDLFSATDVVGSLIGASLLTAIATYIGLILCIIPGLVISSCLMFTQPLIVDQRLGAIEAMSRSWDTLKGQAVMAVVFAIVIGLVAMVGVVACGIGILVTGPLAILSLAITYRNFFPGQPGYGAAATPSAYPPATYPPAGGTMQ